MRVKTIFVSLAVSAFLISPLVVLAQNTATPPGLIDKTGTPRRELGCVGMQNRVNARVKFWGNIKERKLARWDKFVDKLTSFKDKLKDEGKDVSKLETDIATLEAKLNTIKTAYDDVIDQAKDAKTQACGDRTTFNTTLRNLQSLLRTKIQPLWRDLHLFIKNTIRPDILSFRPAGEETETPTPSPTP